MHVLGYLFFNGNAEEALEYYCDVLGGDVDIMRYEGTPAAAHMPADWNNKVMHGVLRRGDAEILMASDTTDAGGEPQNFSLAIMTRDESEADHVFAGLSQGGTVTMPLEKMFWGAKFGMLKDKFGVAWMVNCELSPQGAAAR